MKKALIVIDYVNDFVESDGKLTCGVVAQELDDFISDRINEFSLADDFIVIASDKHNEEDVYSPEHKLFPKHCIENTSGVEVYGKSGDLLKNINQKNIINIDKLRYSAFCATSLDLLLRERKVEEVYLVGVCSDICVLHTAIDAYNLGYKINIYEKGIASFNQDGHNFALSHFKNAIGAKIL